jgi:hypothetical protein
MKQYFIHYFRHIWLGTIPHDEYFNCTLCMDSYDDSDDNDDDSKIELDYE